MARWALCWLLVIVSSTVGVYAGTNALVGPNRLPATAGEHAFIGLDTGSTSSELGSPVCAQAARGLVTAADGAAPDATPQQQAAWDRAAQRVLQACGNA